MMAGLPAEWFAPRLTLGLGNPNTAGALLAMGLVSGLAVCLGGWKRRAFGGLLTAAFAVGLAMAASRGALVALGAGLVVLALTAARSRTDRIFLGGVALVVGFVFCASPARNRLHLPGEDASLASRGRVFAQIPAMVAAAPGGWGAGRSGEAYEEWFETEGSVSSFKHVLSTHAIWLVERGWAVRFLYVGLWVAALGWCRGTEVRGMGGGTACWTVFAVAAGFSHVGERPEMGALPAVWIGLATGVRGWKRCWPTGRAVGVAGALTVGIVVAIFLAGRPWSARCTLDGGVVRLRNDPGRAVRHRVAVVSDGRHAFRLGEAIRDGLPEGVEVEYRWDRNAALGGDTAFLVGSGPPPDLRDGTIPRQVIWASPEGVLPWTLPAAWREVPITVFYGEMSPYTISPWRKYFAEGGKGAVRVFRGEGGAIFDAWGRMLQEIGEGSSFHGLPGGGG